MVEEIPLDKIIFSGTVLKVVNTESEDFERLLMSIKKYGILNSVLVSEKYVLIDGLQRFTACKLLGLKTIPANIIETTPDELLTLQIIPSAVRVPIKPCEYAQHLYRVLAADQSETRESLAAKLCVTPKWISNHLELLNLVSKATKLVNSGQIKLINAFCLAKLPKEEQISFIDEAIQEPYKVFGEKVKARLKELDHLNSNINNK